MKRIYFPIDVDAANIINLDDVDDNTPIFVKENGKLVGMVIEDKDGWIIKLGGRLGATGLYKTRLACLFSCPEYEFFVA